MHDSSRLKFKLMQRPPASASLKVIKFLLIADASMVTIFPQGLTLMKPDIVDSIAELMIACLRAESFEVWLLWTVEADSQQPAQPASSIIWSCSIYQT